MLAAAALRAGPAAQPPPAAHTAGHAADDAGVAAPAWVSAPGLEGREVADTDYRLFVQGVAQAGLRVHQLLKTMAGPPEAASDAFVDMLLRQSQFQPGRRSSVVDLLFEWHGHSGDGAAHAAAEPAPPPPLIPSAVTREMAELWYKRASLFTKLMDAFVLFTFVHREELLHDDFDRVRRGHAPAPAAAPGAAPAPVRPEVSEKRKAEGRESGLRLPRFRGHRSSLLTNEAIWWLNMAVPPPCRHLWRVRVPSRSVPVPLCWWG